EPQPQAMNSRSRPSLWSLLSLLSLSSLLLTLACGRKTDVKPPELIAPDIVNSVTATNIRDGVRIGWARPRVYAAGTTMRDLAGFRVERSQGDGPWQPLATVPVVDRDKFRQARHFQHVDAGAQLGERYRYRVFAFTEDAHTSHASAIAEVVRAM